MSSNEYALVRSRGAAADLHERAIPDPAPPVIWWHDVTSPALVLGSSQDDAVIDVEGCRTAGVDVVRRRSGGGAVLLVPGQVVWFDVIVPVGAARGDAGMPVSDVRGSMVWLGDHLRRVLGAGSVHDGAPVTTAWSRTICFDGVGPGEVLVQGAKLIGISQRRTRDAARFQVCVHTSYDPAALPALLHAAGRPSVDDLRPVAVIDDATAAALPERLRAALSA